MERRSIVRIATARKHQHGPGLATTDIGATELGESIDPFLVVSLYDMVGPTFPPHPHAGFSVATYILPESPIGFVNQDSLGNRNRIAPGALHMTVAGRGVIHEEQPERSGSTARGYQIWIDHANANREVDPYALHLRADDVPIASSESGTVRVVVGESNGMRSPLTPPTEIAIVDVILTPNALFTHRLPTNDQAFVLMLAGSSSIAGQAITAGEVAATSLGDEIAVLAGPAGARLTLFAGKPLRHSKVQGGPFVANDPTQLALFDKAYRAGEFGGLTPFAAQPDWAPSEGWEA